MIFDFNTSSYAQLENISHGDGGCVNDPLPLEMYTIL